MHKKVADANENKDTDRQERNVNDAKEDRAGERAALAIESNVM